MDTVAENLARMLASTAGLCLFGLVVAAADALDCNPGAYFDGIKCSLCPGGTYGDRSGLTSPLCSGLCAGGFFCPEGSTSARENACGRSIYYCPPGSAARVPVTEGYYTMLSSKDPSHSTVLSSTSMTRRNIASVQTKCEPGYYCEAGIRYPCPEGLFGEVYGLQSAACTRFCPLGFYCPLATPHPIPCPPGTFGQELGLKTAACSGHCPPGYYCESGTVTPQPCPAGTLGYARGLTTAACSPKCTQVGTNAPFSIVCEPSPCPTGYFCPLASAQPVQCGSVDSFCPTGSSAPTTVTSGFYTTWTPITLRAGDISSAYVDGNILAAANQTLRSAQRICEKGAYCVGGVKKLCPAGVYGSTLGLATPACTAPCPAGNFCPVGTSDPTAHPCKSEFIYCRQNSTQPTPVSEGYYTTISATTNLRVDQVVCPKGSYCVGGIAKLCPLNTFGSTTGLSTISCSGKCQDGYICDPGSTSATPVVCPVGSYCINSVKRLCPAGTYGSTTGLSTPACSGKCLSTFAICTPGSTSATQTLCPKGSYSQRGIRCQKCPPWFQFTRNACLSHEQHPCGIDNSSCLLT